jgi:thiol:disulfide interchange protein DsbD
MKKTLFRTTVLAAAVFAGGLLIEAGAQTVTGSIAPVTKGKAARATVTLNIPGGLHVNSNRPTSEYAIPTTVRATARGIRIGRVSYPRGRNRKFAFSEQPINVYEGRAVFTFDVTVPETFKGNSVPVRVTVNYQACTEEVCYPPKSKDITLRASIR